MGEGLRQASAALQGGFGAAARAVLLAPAAAVQAGDASLGAVRCPSQSLLRLVSAAWQKRVMAPWECTLLRVSSMPADSEQLTARLHNMCRLLLTGRRTAKRFATDQVCSAIRRRLLRSTVQFQLLSLDGQAIARGVRAVPGAAAAPAEALAGAVRALALGTRNGIDPERYAQRRLDRGLP